MLQSLNNLTFYEKHLQLYYRLINLFSQNIKCHCSKSNLKEYSRCYRILEIPDGSDQEYVRKAFIVLCKKYHPDSGKSTADALKFQEIESAYRTLQNKFAEERWNVNKGIGEYGLYYKEKKENCIKEYPEVFDIKHTAPQHRQYLSFEGIGSGTPSQREKQYIRHRRAVATENVYDHNIKKITLINAEQNLVVKDKAEAKKIKTRYGMERLVEDLIQESMSKGHFNNLKGQGKPLPPSNYNPYIDFVTHKMNDILINNGFAPEWITLQKEITDETEVIRENLIRERKKLGPAPLSIYEDREWCKTVNSLKKAVKELNKKINTFNLVVPVLQKQKLYFNLEKESCVILKSGEYFKEKNLEESKLKETGKNEKTKMEKDALGGLFSFFF